MHSFNGSIFTKFQKDLPQLCFEDHFLRLSNTEDAKDEVEKIIKWRCTYPNCSFKCQTKGCKIGELYEIIQTEGSHIEAPDTKKLSQLEHRRHVKDLAASSEEPPRKIIVKAKSRLFLSN